MYAMQTLRKLLLRTFHDFIVSYSNLLSNSPWNPNWNASYYWEAKLVRAHSTTLASNLQIIVCSCNIARLENRTLSSVSRIDNRLARKEETFSRSGHDNIDRNTSRDPTTVRCSTQSVCTCIPHKGSSMHVH